jgi:hypothetical protein
LNKTERSEETIRRKGEKKKNQSGGEREKQMNQVRKKQTEYQPVIEGLKV